MGQTLSNTCTQKKMACRRPEAGRRQRPFATSSRPHILPRFFPFSFSFPTPLISLPYPFVSLSSPPQLHHKLLLPSPTGYSSSPRQLLHSPRWHSQAAASPVCLLPSPLFP
ncbi:hypothetical protein BRADI_1g60662v3 [Brachypodium distachyon]|uniref:Uncharacterized protein n=1 Tax=Brachypodium distachyon TaxID=15368 RepID=A0A2K2DSP9_BRADI|nr:hypothetical protein BRADI_1g60662v3 [Brachypodium distachyon]